MATLERFENEVSNKYQIYNSLFLTLPFDDINNTGLILPLLYNECKEGFAQKKNPIQIIDDFFKKHTIISTEKEKIDLLFKFIHYIERQVVLFDAIEDSAFEKIHEMDGVGTVKYTFHRAESSNQIENLVKKLETFKVRIVLTAHPTQFYPSMVLAIINDLKKAIIDNDLKTIKELLRQLGKTPFLSKEKPTPYDEATRLIWYLENVLYESVSKIHSRIRKELQSLDREVIQGNNIMDIGFWPGGDRDGNPFVTSDITLKVASELKKKIFICYFRDVKLISKRLTFGGLEEKMLEIYRTISRTIFNEKGKRYETKEELLESLELIRGEIISKHQGFYLKSIDTLIWKVKIFGFHFASIDIRQDSGVHRDVINDIIDAMRQGKLGDSIQGQIPKDYDTLPEEEKINALLTLEGQIDPELFDSELTKDTLRSFYVMKEIQQSNGEKGCHRYIISHAECSLHLMEVFAMAKICGWKEEDLTFDIVPLFETMEDLAGANRIMDYLYKLPRYMAHLKRRDMKQSVMLGFSDGTKDGGYMAANWSIFKAKESITEVARINNVKVIFFDGRGGPPARGGGSTNKFYCSLGSKIDDNEIQLTIQGQTVSSNFGNISSAQYNMEQLVCAGIENHIFKSDVSDLTDKQRNLISDLAKISFAEYTKFKADPKFIDYLENVTVLKYYGKTNIGSRPAKRNKDTKLTLSDLRAIPFVGAWAQMKQNVPGFFGFGTALNAYKQAGKLDEVKELYKNSLFFRTLVGNCMQALSKTYLPLTSYLEDDKRFGDIWKWIFREYTDVKAILLEISEQKELLDNNPSIKASIKLREQIILPLITVQQYALMKVHASEHNDQIDMSVYEKIIVRAFFGSINASRNSV